MNTHCPSCGQRIVQAARRTCADCQQPIRSRHKWFIGTDGRIRHRICSEPDAYTPSGTKAEPPLLTEANG